MEHNGNKQYVADSIRLAEEYRKQTLESIVDGFKLDTELVNCNIFIADHTGISGSVKKFKIYVSCTLNKKDISFDFEIEQIAREDISYNIVIEISKAIAVEIMKTAKIEK